MNPLFQAIYNKYNNSTGHGAYTSIAGRFFHNVAPQESTFPYVVYFSVTDVDELNFTDEIEDFIIQFNIFSENNSSLEKGQILENFKSLWDNCNLTVTDWRHIQFQRSLVLENNDFTQAPPIQGYSVQYDVLIEKQRA